MRNPFDTEERKTFREMVSKFLEAEIWPYVDEWDEAGEYPHEINEKVCELGVFGFGIDEKYGGLGFDDQFMRKDVSVEMGRTSAGGLFASVGSRNIMLGPLTELANEEIKLKALPDLMSGKKGGSLGITEPGGGSDVARMKTTARKDGNEWVLNGSKTFITGGMQASYFVVGARTGKEGLGGISLFFVEADTPGFTRSSIDKKMGWWSSDTATLYFDNCRIPADNLMGEENKGFLAIMNNFNYERYMMGAQMLGMAKRCFEECVQYSQERQTFGKNLIEHQVILSKIKFYCSECIESIASEAMQIFGGAGYLRGNAVERIYREVKVMAIGGGSKEIMKDLTVKQLGL